MVHHGFISWCETGFRPSTAGLFPQTLPSQERVGLRPDLEERLQQVWEERLDPNPRSEWPISLFPETSALSAGLCVCVPVCLLCPFFPRKHREGFFRAEPLDKLHRAKLHRAKLHRAKLHRAKLHRAKLHRAKLHRAKLPRAKLHRAKLHRAKLHRAKLHRAKLHRAKLHRAKLHTAKLHRAKLHRAKLHRAKLHRAKLHRAKLP